MRVPLRATYRVQLGPGFGFDELAAQADYLVELGVSHVYTSPILQAAPGSTHGYDVVDPGRLSEVLGGEAGFARLRAVLERCGLGLVVDIVPNHMSIGSTSNFWWWDVLENGPSSHFAAYFDVDWVPGASRRENRILMPILGERYGEAVERQLVRVTRVGGAFTVNYHDHVLPLAPRSLDWILRPAAERAQSGELHFLATAAHGLPRPTETDRVSTARRHRDKAVIGRMLVRLFADDAAAAAAVDEVIAEINADPDRLDAMLERQNFRIAYWRTAASELGYRRFFDVQTLIGLRVEDPAVHEDTHRLVVGWLRGGAVDGVRVDHPDGLRDPEGYFAALRSAAPEAWITAEKILVPGERLPETWQVDGTTGYDFLVLVDALLRDPEGAAPLGELAARFAGAPQDCGELARAAKREILRDTLGYELARLEELWHRAAEVSRRGRDYTRTELGAALAETLVAFEVYRTYRRPGAPVSAVDVARIGGAVQTAKAQRPDVDAPLFDWLDAILTGADDGPRERELALRFQQVSGALMAKGMEDTTFYRHLRLLAANEVGGGPELFAVSPEHFHGVMAEPGRARTMLASSTHDTKRSEDVRARLGVLSELPALWAETSQRWAELAARHRTDGAPDDADVYFWLQTWLGAWPLDRERALAAMEKSVREAKRRSSWTRPDAAYEAALRGFVEATLADAELAGLVAAFAQRLAPGAHANVLARTLIKLTAPGVPDLYQGTETWELSLVDPDNRRAIEWPHLRRLLATARGASSEAALAGRDDGLAKMWLVQRVLALRAQRPELFAAGYTPLAVTGARAAHAFGFLRGEALAVIVPRLATKLARAAQLVPDDLFGGGAVAAAAWEDTRVALPRGSWRDALSGARVDVGVRADDAPGVAVTTLLAGFPVALLVRTGA